MGNNKNPIELTNSVWLDFKNNPDFKTWLRRHKSKYVNETIENVFSANSLEKIKIPRTDYVRLFFKFFVGFTKINTIALAIFLFMLLPLSLWSIWQLFTTVGVEPTGVVVEQNWILEYLIAHRGRLLSSTLIIFLIATTGPIFRLDSYKAPDANAVAIWAFLNVTVVFGLSVFYLVPLLDQVKSGGHSETATSSDRIVNFMVFFSGLYSAALLLLGNWISGMRNAGFMRMEVTLKLLMESRFSETAQEKGRLLRQNFAKSRPIPEEFLYLADLSQFEFEEKLEAAKAGGIAPKQGAQLSSIYESVHAAKWSLNYYEFIAIGIKNRDFDEDLLRDSIEEMLEDAALISCLLIHNYRYEKNPAIWENLVALLLSWRDSEANTHVLDVIRHGTNAHEDSFKAVFGE
tara:strand:+ start:116 stop:1324 length:1209 start_codon:yes stop_codon:yes gene_type:complete